MTVRSFESADQVAEAAAESFARRAEQDPEPLLTDHRGGDRRLVLPERQVDAGDPELPCHLAGEQQVRPLVECDRDRSFFGGSSGLGTGDFSEGIMGYGIHCNTECILSRFT